MHTLYVGQNREKPSSVCVSKRYRHPRKLLLCNLRVFLALAVCRFLYEHFSILRQSVTFSNTILVSLCAKSRTVVSSSPYSNKLFSLILFVYFSTFFLAVHNRSVTKIELTLFTNRFSSFFRCLCFGSAVRKTPNAKRDNRLRVHK